MRRCSQGLQWRRTCGSRRLHRRSSTMIGPAPISASTLAVDLVPHRSAFPNPLGSAPARKSDNFWTSPSDGIFGFHAGAQWQWGAWVLGAEAALSGCFRSVGATATRDPPSPVPPPTYGAEHKITNLFTVGPRLGYAWDRFMVFATGGMLRPNSRQRCSRSPVFATKPALTVRRATTAGMRAAASTTWSTRARWSTCSSASNINTSTSGSKNAFCFNPGCNPGTAWDEDLSAKGDIVRARLTIKTQGFGFYYR